MRYASGMQGFLDQLGRAASGAREDEQAHLFVEALGCIETMEEALIHISKIPEDDCHRVPDLVTQYLQQLYARASEPPIGGRP
jgi:hypothetical protein